MADVRLIMIGMIFLLFVLLGWLAGVCINLLSDYLPANRLANESISFLPNPISNASALWRRLRGIVEYPNHNRGMAVELGTALMLGILPALIANRLLLSVHALYIAILILIIVIDIEHRLILHVVTIPATIVALGLSLALPEYPSWISAGLGAICGFLFFYLFYLLGTKLYGPGALGFGDVTLSMTMGAMLGFTYIFFALVAGILLGGVFTLLMLIFRRKGMKTYIPYGPYLAAGGIIMLIWGQQVVAWYLG